MVKLMAPPEGAVVIQIYPKPIKGDVLVHPDGTRRTVLRRVDHCSGNTSMKLDNPTHWVLDAVWYVRFYRIKIEKTNDE